MTTVVTYTPGEEVVGSDSFTVLPDDGRGGVAEGKITVTVDEVSGTTKTFRLDFGNVPSAPAAVIRILSAARNQTGQAFELLNLELNDIGTGALSLIELCFRSLGDGMVVDVRWIDDQGEHVFPEVQETSPAAAIATPRESPSSSCRATLGCLFELREPGAEIPALGVVRRE